MWWSVEGGNRADGLPGRRPHSGRAAGAAPTP